MAKTILFIDDDVEVLRVYKTILEDLAEVRTAGTLAEARPLLQGVDLIVLDYHLRDEPTPFTELVTELKQHAPVMMGSGMSVVQISLLVEQHGLSGFWSKGTGLVKLREKVEAFLAA